MSELYRKEANMMTSELQALAEAKLVQAEYEDGPIAGGLVPPTFSRTSWPTRKQGISL
jgi:hypothetical protein